MSYLGDKLRIAKGGTGSSSSSDARNNLGIYAAEANTDIGGIASFTLPDDTENWIINVSIESASNIMLTFIISGEDITVSSSDGNSGNAGINKKIHLIAIKP